MLAETYKDTTCCHRTLKHAKIPPMHMYARVEGKPREEAEEISLSSTVLTDPADV